MNNNGAIKYAKGGRPTFDFDWWSLGKDEISEGIDVTVGRACHSLDRYMKEIGTKSDAYGKVSSVQYGGGNLVKVIFDEKSIYLNWDNFNISTVFSLEHFKDVLTISEFVERCQQCLPGKLAAEETTESVEEIGGNSTADTFSFGRDKRDRDSSDSDVEENTDDGKYVDDDDDDDNGDDDNYQEIRQTVESKIEECFVGLHRIKLENLRPLSSERRVPVYARHGSCVYSQNLHAETEQTSQSATPLLGLIDPKQCRGPAFFSPENLKNYLVEVISGNPSFHGQREVLHVRMDAAMRTREVFLYAGLTNEQCKSLYMMRNATSSNHLPLTDWDYIKLTRDEIRRKFKDGKMPGKNAQSKVFWKQFYAMLGYNSEKKIRDIKRPIETLAKLPDDEFAIVTRIFKEKPSLKASAIMKNFQGVKNNTEKTRLLKTFLVSRAEFQKASLMAKGNHRLRVIIEDGIFRIIHGRQTIQCGSIELHSGNKTLTMTPETAMDIIIAGNATAQCNEPNKSTKHKIADAQTLTNSSDNCNDRHSKKLRRSMRIANAVHSFGDL